MGVNLVAAILTIAALAVGREFFIPLAMALCFHALLRPVVRNFERLGVPSVLGATVVVLSLLGFIIVGGFALSGPVSDFIDRARDRIKAMGLPFRRMSDAAAGNVPSPNPPPAPPPAKPSAPAPTAPAPQPPVPAVVTQILGRATIFVAGVIEVLLLLYLML